MVYLRRLYPFKFFKECLPQILLGPFWNTLSHLILSSEIMMGNCGTQLIYSNYSRYTNSFTALEANFADLLQRRYPENLTMEILQTFHNSNFEEHLSLSASAFSVYKNDVIGLWQMNHSVLKNQVWLSHEYFCLKWKITEAAIYKPSKKWLLWKIHGFTLSDPFHKSNIWSDSKKQNWQNGETWSE